MSAIRYSGALRIRIIYVEKLRLNRCHISCPSVPEQLPAVVHVHPAKAGTVARNTPHAYDQAAKAALSYAQYKGWPVKEYAPFDDGWIISRNAKNSHVWLRTGWRRRRGIGMRWKRR